MVWSVSLKQTGHMEVQIGLKKSINNNNDNNIKPVATGFMEFWIQIWIFSYMHLQPC